MRERVRTGSIPQITMRDVWDSGPAVRPQRPTVLASGFDIQKHVFPKPTQEGPSRLSSKIERITWQVEIHEGTVDLGLIIQFSGVSFMSPVFERSRHDYGPDNRVFYTPVWYRNGQAFLILSTFGDIFESQVVPKTRDVHPFLREEIYYPPLLTLYDPTSMRPSYDNGLVIVSYKARGIANI